MTQTALQISANRGETSDIPLKYKIQREGQRVGLQEDWKLQGNLSEAPFGVKLTATLLQLLKEDTGKGHLVLLRLQ